MALGIVGVVALVAAVVAVALNWSDGSGVSMQDGGASSESTQEAIATYTEDGEVSVDTTSGPGGPSAAELAAGSDSATEVRLCAEGEPLPVLSAPPPSTLGLVALPAGFEAAELEIVFEPYGWGQGGPTGCNLVIKVESAQALSGDTEGLEGISGENASVWVDCERDEILATGGRFGGTVEVRRQGDVGTLFLTELSRV
jgi:hypothetical protein